MGQRWRCTSCHDQRSRLRPRWWVSIDHFILFKYLSCFTLRTIFYEFTPSSCYFIVHCTNRHFAELIILFSSKWYLFSNYQMQLTFIWNRRVKWSVINNNIYSLLGLGSAEFLPSSSQLGSVQGFSYEVFAQRYSESFLAIAWNPDQVVQYLNS